MVSRMDRSIEERFLKHVMMIPFHDCWEWIASRDRWNYGKFKLHGRMRIAPRISYLLFNGEITDGLFVMHTCDNPGCVNPRHLKLGTHMDNMRDRKEKGRYARPHSVNARPHPEVHNSIT